MQLLLAPMEGLLDYALRDTLTRFGGIDRCVSEFIRVTDRLLPPRVFQRVMPELHNGGCTAAGVPVRGQLLGSEPSVLADNAGRLAELGSHGVDLNFGCPAKVVNRHGGGSALLQEPELLWRIVSAVRRSVPAGVTVSAKMRLGYHDDALAEDCARAIADGGAGEIVVHARTRAHGYRPPAYWARIADLRATVSVPLVANGEIWTAEDALRCQQQSGCTHLMLGRGMVADPGLALAIRQAAAVERAWTDNFNPKQASPLDLQHSFAMKSEEVSEFREAVEEGEGSEGGTWGAEGRPGSACHASGAILTAWAPQVSWPVLQTHMATFWALVEQRVERRHRAGRLKQWLNLLRRRYPQAQAAFEHLRLTNDATAVAAWVTEGAGAAPLATCADSGQ